MRINLVLGISMALSVCGYAGEVGKPTDQEVTQMNAWAEVVTPKDRLDVTRQANQHTDWMERKKVQWITGEYVRRYNKEKGKSLGTRALTRPVTQPAVGAFETPNLIQVRRCYFPPAELPPEELPDEPLEPDAPVCDPDAFVPDADDP